MNSIKNQHWIYIHHPDGVVSTEHYDLRSEALDTTLAAGEVLVEAQYI